MFGFGKIHIETTDEELMKRLSGGDAAAFNHLYKRYNQRLLYYFYRMLGNSNEKAQDFLQDLFVKLIDKAETFDSTRKFSTWIFSIAHNLCKNEYRRLNVRKEVSIETQTDTFFADAPSEADLKEIHLEEFQKDLFEQLDTLDEIHKSVFLLHYREAFSIKEIAQSLEISEGTVKSRLFYTRKQLAERLKKYKPDFVA